MLVQNNIHWGRGCQCDKLLSRVAPRVVFLTSCSATGRCGVITLTAPPYSSVCIPRTYILSFRLVHTYGGYLNSLALGPNGWHFLIVSAYSRLFPGIQIEKCQCGLDVDLVLFRRQATAGTSDGIDHRRIHASPVQNLTLPHSMTIERYLYVFVFILYSVLLTLFFLTILYVYLSIIVLRITPLFISFLL